MYVVNGMSAAHRSASVDGLNGLPAANRLPVVLIRAQANTNELSLGTLPYSIFVADALRSGVMTVSALSSFRQEEGESNGNYKHKLQLSHPLLETAEKSHNNLYD
jgi:hypothetical protein